MSLLEEAVLHAIELGKKQERERCFSIAKKYADSHRRSRSEDKTYDADYWKMHAGDSIARLIFNEAIVHTLTIEDTEKYL